MMRRSRNWFAFADQGAALPRGAAARPCSRGEELRYGENPHQQAALLPARRARTRAASPRPSRFRARRSATTITTMPTPRSSWSREFRDAGAGLRHRQARQSLRRRRRGEPAPRPMRPPSPATASRPSAASSRSTGRSTARPPRRSPAIFTEVVIAPDADEEAQAAVRGEEEPAPAAHRRPARSGAAGHGAEVDRRRLAGPDPRQWPRSAPATSRW